ncbi:MULTISPECIES: LPXTG cell wall anchor domain-containing protein [unclassified Bifidobacterium]|uniref:LPXTG cell wall anchor domain-containing protein n=1 Tax=unclassified Bifidobacterium TaxID=2608897 RepID=UPI00112C1025|nr:MULTISPECIES: LPXTG cell wall anchor domain-containing protein [unclassified Bifidobacterium]TPF78243.1 hypothetical protein BW09_05325 [Bifidobacterium sp. UTCIF-1]TPF80014.1 hypothetical protein BW08_06870 [Bifidobacterium sp. UTCIF-24]TPF82521.1 hypothetical protein BW12_04590 [Bifidobacterium sp. UTCIF-3]TPF84109.1 hypothetical protein BW07_06275 [Bifidobacterium sp. UTCIF-36]TPF89353.1 hypothetical protein BW10_06540 [Bifidobacterium sp. UTBIF-56]
MGVLGRKCSITAAIAAAVCLLVSPMLALGSPDGAAGTGSGGVVGGTAGGHGNTADTASLGWYLPNKAWVHMGDDGVWRMVSDPERDNHVGADGMSFLDGDVVAAAVNFTVPWWDEPTRLELVDDWTLVDRYLDVRDVSEVRVYVAEMDEYDAPSLDGINVTGKDVTDRFDIVSEGMTVTAKATAEYLASLDLRERRKSLQFSMLVPFDVRFDVREDLQRDIDAMRTRSGSLDNTCSDGKHELVNRGGVFWADHEYWETNEPRLCIVRPEFDKDVTASETEGGDGSSIDGRSVLPGQTVTYELELQVGAASDYTLHTLEFVDEYDVRTTPVKESLTVIDARDGVTVPAEAYDVEWDDAGHKLSVSFRRDWLDEHWDPYTGHRYRLEFDATVSEDAATDTVIANRGWITLNNSGLESNEVTNRPVDPQPVKQDTQADAPVDIDGKTVLVGDRLYYRITIDAAGLADPAYPVRRLGVIDDYDETVLDVDEAGIQVLDEQGADVTDRVNVQVADGVVYAFFKTVDTTLVDGTVLPGDPQPADLAEYARRELSAERDAGIDQSLLGKTYQLVLPMTVIAAADGGSVENTAVQVTNKRRAVSNTVTNVLARLDPFKDVTVDVGADSADGMSLYKDQLFLYRLDSSLLPANRAYPQVTEWRIDDDYDESGDEYAGQWAVYAAEDLHDAAGSVIAAKGSRIAGSGFDSAKFGGDLFSLDMRDGTFTVAATQRYLDLVSADGAHAQAWRAYVQFRRVKAGEFSNTFTETLNGVERPSNTVTTRTPERSPSVVVEKFDEASGLEEGDRDDTKDALEITGDGTTIVFRITNTGDVPLTGLELSDETIAGDGTVTDLRYPDGWAALVLQPGESVDVTGTLTGVTDLHTDRATVQAAPVIECVPKDDDPFDDKPAQPVEPGTVCTDTPITSEPDDWSAYMKRMLPHTGVDLTGIITIGVLVLLTGFAMLRIAHTHRRNPVSDL